jgi:DNA primase
MPHASDKDFVLSRLSFEQFYREAIPSLKMGHSRESTALCPFHNDHHPSFSINLETGLCSVTPVVAAATCSRL